MEEFLQMMVIQWFLLTMNGYINESLYDTYLYDIINE